VMDRSSVWMLKFSRIRKMEMGLSEMLRSVPREGEGLRNRRL
jgi:hypothetical protein